MLERVQIQQNPLTSLGSEVYRTLSNLGVYNCRISCNQGFQIDFEEACDRDLGKTQTNLIVFAMLFKQILANVSLHECGIETYRDANPPWQPIATAINFGQHSFNVKMLVQGQ
jgi:hypothetical protein